MRLMNSGDVARVCGMDVDQVDDWCRRGVIRPIVPARGTGRHRLFAAPQILAIAVGRYLRQHRRLRFRLAAVVMSALHQQDEMDLAMAFAAGRTHMAVVEERATGLLPPDDLPLDAQVSVDVAKAYRKIMASIETLEPALT